MSLDPTPDCSCAECVECCTREPGRFAPGGAEKAAKLLGVPFQKFKRAFLVKDYWSGGACVWAPRKLGVERPSNPNDPVEYEYAFQPGRCVFLGRVGRCRIHEAKPIECRATDCSVLKHNMREEINALWEAAGSPLGRG